MAASIERLFAVAGVLVALLPIPARAQPASLADADEPALPPEPPPPARAVRDLRLRLEARGGIDAPLGTLSGAIVFEATPRLSLGAGAGAALGQPQGPYPQFGVFARAPLWRRGSFAVGPVVTFSAGNRARNVVYQRPQFVHSDSFEYRWKPGFRLDLGVGAELGRGRWSLRLEAGLGLLLNDPRCWYRSNPQSFVGACDAPEIPAYYHFTFEPGRLAPYVSLALGVGTADGAGPSGVSRSAPVPREAPGPEPRTESAWLAPTALTVPAGSMTLTLYELFLVRFTVGFSERVQLSVGTSWSTFLGAPAWDVGAKATLVDVGRFHLAVLGEHVGLRLSAWTGVLLVGGGPVASLCLDAACASVLSFSALYGALHRNNDESPDTTTVDTLASPSVVIALLPWLKVAAEAHLPATAPGDGLWATILRMHVDGFALDLGALGELSSASAVIPAGSVGYRW